MQNYLVASDYSRTISFEFESHKFSSIAKLVYFLWSYCKRCNLKIVAALSFNLISYGLKDEDISMFAEIRFQDWLFCVLSVSFMRQMLQYTMPLIRIIAVTSMSLVSGFHR